MDSKTIFRALLWAFVAFFTWQIVSVWIWGPQVRPAATTQPVSPADHAESGLTDAEGVPAGAAAQTDSTTQADAQAAQSLAPQAAELAETFTLGSVEGGKDGPWRMQLSIDNRGAALAAVRLSDHRLEAESADPYLLLAPVETEGGDTLTSLTLERLTVDQREIDLGSVRWPGRKARRQGADLVTFKLPLVDPDGRPVLELTAEYELPEQPAAAGRSDLYLTWSVANVDDQPHDVVATLRGPVGVHREDPRVDERAVTVASPSGDVVRQKSQTFPKVTDAGEVAFARAADGEPYWWAAAVNKFFACIIAPVTQEGQEGPPFVRDIKAVNLDPKSASGDAVALRLATTQQSIPPGQTVKYPFQCYFGPQERRSFTDPKNADYARRNYYLLVARNYSWCTFGWLTELMMWLLDLLVHVPPWNYGVAVIILVLVVRVLLHPITKKGQVNMMKMQKQMGKLAPKLEELKKQYANDKVRLNQEMQKVYQSEGINPAGQMLTCLPMMLQMPIWVALYTGLNNNIAMRHQPFCLWINDLTGPDRLIEFGGSFHIPLLGAMTGPISSLNILPILWAVGMYLQQKLMPKPKTPEGISSPQVDQAAQMQKMMPFMSVLFALMFYNAPSGLTLYILASTIFGTVEQLRIRQHIKEIEERGGLEAVRGAKPKGPRGPLWWRRMREQVVSRLQDLQKQADQAPKMRRKN